MVNDTDRPRLLIKRTAHGKPYYERIIGIDEDVQVSPLHDALDFPGNEGRDAFELGLQARYPGIEVRYEEDGLDFVAEIRSIDRKVDRDEFVEDWQYQLQYAANSKDYSQIKDSFLRAVPVRLSGKDRVRWWSGWFHYQWLIENSRREMEVSGERLQSLFEGPKPRNWRDVVEEAYYEQVQRRRLAIFERRREWWRVVRWGLTTVLGVVLTLWSGIQIWDRFFGG